MAAPIDDLQLGANRLRASAGVPPLTDPEATAGGAAAAVLRNTPMKAPVAPTEAAAPAPTRMGRAVAGARQAGAGIVGAPQAALNALRTPTAMGAGGTALAGVSDALRTGKVLTNENATWNDVGTQAAEGVGKVASAGAGAALGAGLGAAAGAVFPPAIPITTALGGVAGGAAGYVMGDKAIKGLRGLMGQDTRSPDERLGVAPASATPVAPTPTAPTPTSPTFVAPNPTDQRLASTIRSSAPAGPAGGTITRVGNSYSGSNVAFGADIVGGGQGGLIKNQPNNEDGSPSTLRGGGTVSSLDTSEGHRQNLLELQRNAAERASAPQGPVNHGDLSGSWRADNDRRNRESSFKNAVSSIMNGNMKPRDKRAAMALLYEQYNTERKLESGEAVAEMGNATSLRNNAANNATARRSNDQNNQTSLRGQDMHLEGQLAPARLAAQQRGLHAQVYKGVGAGGTPSADHHLAAAAQFDAMGLKEQAVEARAAATSMQALRGAQDAQTSARAADTEKVFRPMFTRDVTDAQGNVKQEFDDVGAAKAAATVRGIYGEKFDSLSPEQKRSAYTEIATKQKNQAAETQVMPGFVDRVKDVVGLYQAPAPVNAPRNLRGGQIEKAGLISPPGVHRNSTLVRLPDGRTVNYGQVDADQLTDIQSRLRP